MEQDITWLWNTINNCEHSRLQSAWRAYVQLNSVKSRILWPYKDVIRYSPMDQLDLQTPEELDFLLTGSLSQNISSGFWEGTFNSVLKIVLYYSPSRNKRRFRVMIRIFLRIVLFFYFLVSLWITDNAISFINSSAKWIFWAVSFDHIFLLFRDYRFTF